MKNSILLVDDNQQMLDELSLALQPLTAGGEADVRTWLPTNADGDPESRFESFVDDGTVLVVTDYDLTARGKTGLFGSTVVEWCQKRSLPVADYSRGHPGKVPKEPSLFEMRIPDDAGAFIISAFRGFLGISSRLANEPAFKSLRSPAAVLAAILERPELENDLALYGARLSSNATLLEKVSPGGSPPPNLISYIVSHMLLNSVLRFPGPIINKKSLLSYVACGPDSASRVLPVFTAASYEGPFSGIEPFFWISKVDQILFELQNNIADGLEFETPGELNRLALESKLGELPRHKCTRCAGINGGFLCPFTRKTVCPLPDCSVSSNSWIPQGARLCRIERDFYEEWAPILGF